MTVTADAPPIHLIERLKNAGQDHLLAFWTELGIAEREAFQEDIELANPEKVNEVFASLGEVDLRFQGWTFSPPTPLNWVDTTVPPEARDACFLTRLDNVPHEISETWRQRGLRLLASEKIGALIMAGGQATRLGWGTAKGIYPIGAVSGKSLFQVLVERHIAARQLAQKAFGTASIPRAPLYIMTSEGNHQQTADFFARHDYFGLPSDDVVFFEQTTIPCVDKDGKILLAEKGRIARNPNGNGGLFEALKAHGILEDLVKRGIIGLHVFGVDNCLMKVLDPTFIGYVDICEAPIGNKCAYKTNPDEKVGMMCQRRPESGVGPIQGCVVEYADLPSEMRHARQSDRDDAPLTFSAGSICNHYFTVDFLIDIIEKNNMQQFYAAHAAHKKIPCIDLMTGKPRNPEKPNGLKIEYFIFDCFALASSVAGLEVPRESDFAPAKNAEGEDSPASCRAMMDALHKAWARKSGWRFSGDGFLEISPLVSYEGEGLASGRAVQLPAYIDK